MCIENCFECNVGSLLKNCSFYANEYILNTFRPSLYSLEKLTFMYKLAKLNNICLKVCFAVYKWSTEFNSLL